MNEVVNKFLLAVDKLMPEKHFRQPGFTCNACGLFSKNEERIQKLQEKEDLRYTFKDKSDRACVQHNMAYGDFKDF